MGNRGAVGCGDKSEQSVLGCVYEIAKEGGMIVVNTSDSQSHP